jgi:hypothetical protein
MIGRFLDLKGKRRKEERRKKKVLSPFVLLCVGP